MDWWVIGGLLSAVGLVVLVRYLAPVPRTVREHERGLRFRKGHLVGEFGPGRYWLSRRLDELIVVDIRRRQSVVSGQEVLTSDRVPLKVSLIAEFTVANPTKAVGAVERFEEALHGRIQLALREAIASRELDVALAERSELGAAILELVHEGAAEFGVELHSVQVRDFMMAGGLRGAYTEVIQAKQQGIAALERARGESAAIRSLANAAQLMEKHPGIMQLRLLQAVESGSGNRVVIALDPERGKGTDLSVSSEGDT